MWWLLSQPFLITTNLLGLLVLILYYYGTNTYDYWKKKGVPYIKPKFPFLGTLFEDDFSLKTLIDQQQEIYNYFNGQRFGGIFSFKMPVLFVKDPDLIESIMIKDFASFYNRGAKIEIKLNPLSAHLFNLVDNQWKSLRQKLTPTFSSGKIKLMHEQLEDCSEALIEHIGNLVTKSEPMDAKTVMAYYSVDVIGKCVFGLNSNALKDADSEFRAVGNFFFQTPPKTKLRLALKNQYPTLVRLLQWKGKSSELDNFFKSIIYKTMEYRRKHNLERNDFVHLLFELKAQELENHKDELQEIGNLIVDDDVIAANIFVFFVAGFETTASTLSYCLYELSLHQDIQEKAYHHVVSILKKHGGEITYNAVKEMTFIHQIFAEILRMHPPLGEIKRVVTRDYVIPGTKVLIPKGSSIVIPVFSLHNDPEYFPEPEKFKPERFRKDNIRSGTYLPFGDGPRICIGKRFAEMEMQAAVVKLLLNFQFQLHSKTISPLVYNPKTVFIEPIGGIWLDVKKRF